MDSEKGITTVVGITVKAMLLVIQNCNTCPFCHEECSWNSRVEELESSFWCDGPTENNAPLRLFTPEEGGVEEPPPACPLRLHTTITVCLKE